MIGKTIKGRNFAGVFRYLLSEEKCEIEGARLLGGTAAGRTKSELTEEFESISRLAKRAKKVVYHQVLRPPHVEGKRLSNVEWLKIAAAHAKAMGYGEGLWVVIRHDDHVHIVASRVLFDGKVLSDSHDFARAEASVRAIEKRFGLTEVQSSHLLEPRQSRSHVRAFSQPEIALADKGEVSARADLQNLLKAVLDRPQSFTEFADRLYELGVLVRPNVQSTGRLIGLSFFLLEQPDLEFAGGRLGRRFTLSNLKKKDGLTYDVTQDSNGISRCLQRCEVAGSSQSDGGISDSQNGKLARLVSNCGAFSRGDRIDDGRSRDDIPRTSGRNSDGRELDRQRQREHPEDIAPADEYSGDAQTGDGTDFQPVRREPKLLEDRAAKRPDGAADRSSFDRMLDLVGRPGDADPGRGPARLGTTGPRALPANAARAPGTVQRAIGQPDRPLADPDEARRHLNAIGVPVELAVRYPGKKNKIRKLGVVDSVSLDRWSRRLRRRSALGQEILIRPRIGAPIMLLPGLSQQHEKNIEGAGIEPFLRIDAEWQRRDLWIRLATDGQGKILAKPHATLEEAGIIPSELNATSWGHLAGYRPDPKATERSMAALLVNRIVELRDGAVELSQALLERLVDRARRRKHTARQAEREIVADGPQKKDRRSR